MRFRELCIEKSFYCLNHFTSFSCYNALRMNEIVDLGLLIYLLFALKQKVTKIQKYTVVRKQIVVSLKHKMRNMLN